MPKFIFLIRYTILLLYWKYQIRPKLKIQFKTILFDKSNRQNKKNKNFFDVSPGQLPTLN